MLRLDLMIVKHTPASLTFNVHSLAVFTPAEIGSGQLRSAEFEKRASQFSHCHAGMWVEQYARGNNILTKSYFSTFQDPIRWLLDPKVLTICHVLLD